MEARRRRRRRVKAVARRGAVARNRPVVRLSKAVDLNTLFRLRNRIRQQFHDCSAALQIDQTPCLDHIVDEEFLQDAADDLERITEELKLAFENKTLALQRMQFGFNLKSEVKRYDNESRLIIGSMKHITMLSGTVIAYQQQAREKECKLMDIKRKRLTLKKITEQKILQIHILIKKLKEKQGHLKESKVLEKIRHNMQKERQRIILLQNVFQNILISSRVNWAKDPSLKAIALQFENYVCSA